MVHLYQICVDLIIINMFRSEAKLVNFGHAIAKMVGFWFLIVEAQFKFCCNTCEICGGWGWHLSDDFVFPTNAQDTSSIRGWCSRPV
jgi:hypothetical protein